MNCSKPKTWKKVNIISLRSESDILSESGLLVSLNSWLEIFQFYPNLRISPLSYQNFKTEIKKEHQATW